MKKVIHAFLGSFIAMLMKWQRHVASAVSFSNEKKYDDLAPSGKIENAGNYFEALDYALGNPEIKNIALTGTYGSGKSSILKAYQAERPGHRYLNISLATFDDQAAQSDTEREKVEISILQQIFYHVKHRDIPDSRFKRIRQLSTKGQFFLALLVLLWLIAVGITARISYFVDLPILKNMEGKAYYLPATFIIAAGITFLFLFWLIRSFRQARFSKLNVIKGEIEIDEIGKTSVLNAYLDEILYFFEVNHFDVVIIEDLDRFKDPAIFTKLREINNLLNNSKQINRRIIFIYAIKDDMFKDRNRPKFFEFIIPVIPVINPSNSLDIFLRKLNAANIKDAIDKDFLGVVTAYIDDMRMLKNIVNEYQLYRHILSDKLDQNMLFSMIIYKNLHPSDFAELHIGSGLIYQAFQAKPGYIAGHVRSWKDRVKEIDKQLSAAELVFPKNARELRMIYIAQIFSHIPDCGMIRIATANVATEQLLDEAKFDELRHQNPIRYYDRYSSQSLGFGFDAIQKEVDENQTYAQRLEAVKQSSDDTISQLKKERTALQKKITDAQALTLSDILITISIDILPEALQQDKLTVYLLRNGYISEMYYSYISYFYGESITIQDQNFLFAIWNYEKLPYDHELVSKAELIKRISLAEFSQTQILNYSLLDYFLENRFKESDKRKAFVATVLDNNGKTSFIDGYFQRGVHIEGFVKLFAEAWPDWWHWLEKQSRFDDSQLSEYLESFVLYVDVDVLSRMNKEECFSKHIAKMPDFITRYGRPELQSKIEALIKKLDVYFTELLLTDTQNPLCNYILNNDRYEINPHMVVEILDHKKPSDIDTDTWRKMIREQNYTSIGRSGFKPLAELVESNIEIYVQDVFTQLPENTKEDGDAILQLLSNVDLSVADKETVLESQTYVLQELSAIPKDLYKKALETDAIVPTWANMLTYYSHAGSVDQTMIEYINKEKHYKGLAATKLKPAEENKDAVEGLTKAILTENEISESAYLQLASSMEMQRDLELDSLSAGKLKVLIDKNLLVCNDTNLAALRSIEGGFEVAWLEKKVMGLSKNITEFVTLEPSEFAALLLSNQVSNEKKQNLLSVLTPEIVKGNAGLANAVTSQVLSTSTELKSELYQVVFDLTDRAISLLVNQMEYLSREDVNKSLQKLGDPYNRIINGSHTKMAESEINIRLAQLLKRHGLISSFSIDSRKGHVKLIQFRKR